MTPKPKNTEEPDAVVGCHAPACSPSDTPETDAMWKVLEEHGWHLAKGHEPVKTMMEVVERLERERNEARRQLEAECRSWNTLTNENAELRIENAFLRRGIIPENAKEQATPASNGGQLESPDQIEP